MPRNNTDRLNKRTKQKFAAELIKGTHIGHKPILMAVALILLLTIATAPFIGVGFAITGGESSGPVKRPIPVWTEDTPGPWTSIRYNESRGAYNEYSKAPNTSHILWIKDATLGGVVGGDVQESITGLNMINPVAVAMGRYWYAGGELRASKAESTPINGGGTLVCLDEYTGEEIYTTVYPGNASRWGIGTIVFDTSATLKTGGATIYTSCYGGVYATDAYSGLSMFNFRVATPNGTEILGPDGLKYYNGRIYVTDHSGGIGYWCYKAGDQERSVTPSSWIPDWYLPLASGDRPDYISDGILCSGRIGINATTGEILWTNTGFQGSGYGATGYGKIFTGGIDGNYYALDVKTGTQVWKSTIHAGLWGYGACVVNGKVYQGNYNGKFYCFDAETGNVEWEFNFNDYQANRGLSIPTVYTDRGWGWPLSAGPVGAEGKIYQVTDQHSPDQPRIDGHLLLCFDAESGQTLWTYPCSSSSHCMPMIADDMLFAINTYTGQVVCFGKGETAVEVSVAQGQISNGDYTWINGRVTDQSPAQKDTPCVAKESMDEWMAYLHASKAEPATDTVKGVPVTLCATDSTGHTTEIGTITTDSQGYFSYKWTPPAEDQYTITAQFAGDESYWDSYGLTTLAVGPQVQESGATEVIESATGATETKDYTVMFVVLIVAVAVAIVLGVFNLRALKKWGK